MWRGVFYTLYLMYIIFYLIIFLYFTHYIALPHFGALMQLLFYPDD